MAKPKQVKNTTDKVVGSADLKYELIKENPKVLNDGKTTLYQIKALKDINITKNVIDPVTNVTSTQITSVAKTGDLGGYIENEKNLSHEGGCWVSKGANVKGTSRIKDDARIYGGSNIINSTVKGNSVVMQSLISNGSTIDSSKIKGWKIYDSLVIKTNLQPDDKKIAENGNVIKTKTFNFGHELPAKEKQEAVVTPVATETTSKVGGLK